MYGRLITCSDIDIWSQQLSGLLIFLFSHQGIIFFPSPFAFLTPCFFFFFFFATSKLSFTPSLLLLVYCHGQFLVLSCQLDCLSSSGQPSSPWLLFFCQEGCYICALYPWMLREYLSNWQLVWLLVATWHGEWYGECLHLQLWAFKKLI